MASPSARHQPLASLMAPKPAFMGTENLDSHRGTAEPAPVDASPQNDEVDAANALLLLLPTAEKQASIALPSPAALPDENPGATFYPGLIVWAKVEGHSFWPAQVVRRRAVPRTEVGPPPGGPGNVMNCFPVVFMNQNGIPAEICDTMESRIGSSRAGMAANEDQEAEYAWVLANSLRPFVPGNYELVQDHIHQNSELATCVRAAEDAVRARPPASDEALYDSDGGWGSAQPTGPDAGSHSTRRARTNRSRGARRVRNRRAVGSAEDGDGGGFSFHAPQIVVDAILGWRHAPPLSDQNGGLQRKGSAAGSQEREFLIKWHEHSHIRNEWVAEGRVMALAKRKLLNFTKKYGSAPVNLSNEKWTIPERFVARRKCPYTPGWEVLVKWTDLGYESCTWENELEPIICDERYVHLLKDFWQRHYASLERSNPQALEAYNTAVASAAARLPGPSAGAINDTPYPQPSHITAAPLEQHQLSGVSMLQRMYVHSSDVVIADDPAMGMVATVLTFLQVVRKSFQPVVPSLIIVPNSSMAYWKGEVQYWLDDNSEVVFYTGPPGARQQIAQNELWLHPGALDGKVRGRVDFMKKRVPKPHIVVISMESMLQDIEEMKAMPWDIIVLDERHASKSFAQKMYPVLHELSPKQRVAMRESSGETNSDQLLAWAAFLKPSQYKEWVSEMQNPDSVLRAKALEQLRNQILPLVRCTRFSDLPKRRLPQMELQIPVPLSVTQAESYRITLAKQYEQLGNHKAQRHSGQRASMLRSLCADICRVCNHPYTLEQFEPEADSQRHIADYVQGSGKLQVLQHLLDVLLALHKRAIIAAHESMGVLCDYLTLKYGECAFHKISDETMALDRDRAIADFNNSSKPQDLLVLEVSACSLGTDFKTADAVIIYDSDGHPASDIQRFGHARSMGDASKLLVYRLYCAGTLEEVIVAGGSGSHALAKALRPTTHRLSAADARLLEESLRFGATKLFAADLEAAERSEELQRTASASVAVVRASSEGQKAKMEAGDTAAMKSSPEADGGDAMNTDGARPSAEARDAQKVAKSGAKDSDTQSLEAGDGGDDPVEQQGGTNKDGSTVPPIAQEPPAMRAQVTEAPGKTQLRSMISALEQLLVSMPESLENLPQEMSDALQGAYVQDWRNLSASIRHGTDVGQYAEEDDENVESEEQEEGTDKMSVSMLASSSAAFWQRMLRLRWERLQAEEAEALLEQEIPPAEGPEEDVSEELPRVSNSNGSQWPGDETESRGARQGRQTRTRRPVKRRFNEESPSPPPQPAATPSTNGAAQTREDPGSPYHPAGSKRTRHGEAANGAAIQPGVPLVATGGAPPSQAALLSLRSQFETIVKALQDPSSLVNGIYKRATDRLRSMVGDAGLDINTERDRMVFNYALQAAQILLIMRPQNELPSDFQDYTLIALIAVAAHLSSHPLGSEDGINALANKYQQAPVDLRSVFNHILGQMSEYRMSTDMMRSQQVAVSYADTLQPLTADGSSPDAFITEVENVTRIPTAMAAANAGGIPEEAVAEYDHRMAWVQQATGQVGSQGNSEANLALIENVRGWTELQKQLVTAELAHKWRIDAVTQKYQAHMEKVRTCAQRVIDSINESYKTEKVELENKFGAICGQMQALASQSTLGPHLSAHLGANDATADAQIKSALPRPFHS